MPILKFAEFCHKLPSKNVLLPVKWQVSKNAALIITGLQENYEISYNTLNHRLDYTMSFLFKVQFDEWFPPKKIK